MAEKEPDFSYIYRLQEEQNKVYVDCQERLATWEKFKSDYEALEKRLSSLPDKTSHDVMVPFGSLAFVPGKLVHTNEIMVLLGDSWFAERSARQALEIVGRRKQHVEKNIDGIKADIESFEAKMGFTSYFEQEVKDSGFFEIKEELSKEDEEKLKSRRRIAHPKAESVGVKRVTGLRQSDKKLLSSSGRSKVSTDDDLFARLDELETKEKKNRELENLDVDEGDKKPERGSTLTFDELLKNSNKNDQCSQLSDTSRNAIWWADTEPTREEGHCSSGSDDDSDGKMNLIKVTFTEQKNIKKKSETKLTQAQEICSPADIYKTFASASKPQSILKALSGNPKTGKGSAGQVVDADTLKQHQSSEKRQFHPEKAFSGEIVERSRALNNKTSSQPEEVKGEEKKKISKFKAGRRNIK